MLVQCVVCLPVEITICRLLVFTKSGEKLPLETSREPQNVYIYVLYSHTWNAKMKTDIILVLKNKALGG